MFKNLWYKIFGHPTVDAAMADFQKIHDKLHNVLNVHGALAEEQDKIITKAAVLRGAAVAEMEKARVKIAKIIEWL